MGKRRVVITGMGVVSSLSLDLEGWWRDLCSGKSGIHLITGWDTTHFETKFAAEIKNWTPDRWISPKDKNRLDPFSQYAVAAASMSLEDSGLDGGREDPDRIGVIIGSGIGGLQVFEEQHRRMVEKGPEKVSPFFIPKMMMNAAAAQVSIRFGFRGPNYAVASACASANHALGCALRTVQYGDADVVVTGGTEATVTPVGMAGFIAPGALSKRNDAPEKASRPFDKNRDGFVMGEGCGVLIFEEVEHAKKRGARIYAEVAGFGTTGDAHHITAPVPNGAGATKSMVLAVKDAGRRLDEVDYVNAHGTSTPLNDVTETRAIHGAFGEHAKKLAISSTKSMIGHLLGASGAVELIATALSIHHQTAHPTANYETRDPECDLDYIPGAARPMKIEMAISNSFGFGGHNATVAVSRFRG
ncbi:MAG: beta-ketoacyl-ACP synthase II [Planctomycetales bacterium]|nr:beta-ketoacyl-ACP synthase II [Planctomycetales bacterium]